MFNVSFMGIQELISDLYCSEKEKNKLRVEINRMEENGISKLGYNVSFAKCSECGREMIVFHVPQHRFPYECSVCGNMAMYIDTKAEDKFEKELEGL